MAIFTAEVQQKLTDILKDVQDEVQLFFFTQEIECRTCKDAHIFVEEFAALSDKIAFSVHEFLQEKELAGQYGVDKIPAIVVTRKDKKDLGIRFYGIPGGYEINSFIATIKEVSGNKEELPPAILEQVRAIDKKVHLQVFVTMTCPYCPGAVITAHRLALENENIQADMVDASVFPELSIKYQVMGVPKTVINETGELVGAQPLPNFLKAIEEV